MEVKEIIGGELSEKEVEYYIDVLREKVKKEHPDRLIKSIIFKIEGDEIRADYTFESKPFERIRRITGYLVGDLTRFNDAKYAEVNDRVKHSLAESEPG